MVDANISDLFFNTNFDGCVVKDAKGRFSHYDELKLSDEAASFLGCLERLNVAIPSSTDLIADFYKRI